MMTACTNTVSYRTVKDIRDDAFQKLSRGSPEAIDGQSHGDLIARVVTDTDMISDGLLQGFTQLFSGVVTILGTLGFMLSVNVHIALVVVVLTPLSLFVASFYCAAFPLNVHGPVICPGRDHRRGGGDGGQPKGGEGLWL